MLHMKTITLVIDSFGSGGGQRVAAQLDSAWVAAGHPVRLISFHGADSDFHAVPQEADRVVVGGIGASLNPLAGLLANLRRAWRLRQALRADGVLAP